MPSQPHHPSPDVKQIPVSDLLALHTRITTELLARKVARSRTAPGADLAELLVEEAYHGERAPRSEKGWDVVADGRRLLVKSRVVAPSEKRALTYSPITSWEFDACVFVLIDGTTYRVIQAIELPVSEVQTLTEREGATTPHRIRITDELRELPGARDVGGELEKALEKIDQDRFARRQEDSESTQSSERTPTGECLCGCGKRVDPGAFFLVMHDRRAESAALREHYGTVSGLDIGTDFADSPLDPTG